MGPLAKLDHRDYRLRHERLSGPGWTPSHHCEHWKRPCDDLSPGDHWRATFFTPKVGADFLVLPLQRALTVADHRNDSSAEYPVVARTDVRVPPTHSCAACGPVPRPARRPFAGAPTVPLLGWRGPGTLLQSTFVFPSKVARTLQATLQTPKRRGPSFRPSLAGRICRHLARLRRRVRIQTSEPGTGPESAAPENPPVGAIQTCKTRISLGVGYFSRYRPGVGPPHKKRKRIIYAETSLSLGN